MVHGAPEVALAYEFAVAVDETPATPEPTPPVPEIRRFVGYQLLTEVSLTGGIWILYLQDRGLSLGQIGLAESVFHLAPLTLELPTGSLADTFGRKWSLAIGSLLVAISAALMFAARDLWLVLPAMYLQGASYTFRSGAQQAFLFDSLAAGNAQDRFSRTFGRLASLSYVVIGATTWLGAALADWSFAWPYGITIAVALGAAWLAAELTEPEREKAEHRSVVRNVVDALRLVRSRPRLASLLIFGSIYWTLVACLEMYAQPVLKEMGLATAVIGVVIGGSFVVVAAGAWVAHRVMARGSFRVWTIGMTIAVIAMAFGLGSDVVVLALVTYVLAEFATGLFEPTLADRVNRQVDGAQRATVLSVEGFLFSLNMIWVFPLVGWLADRASWLVAFGTVAALVAAALGVWLVLERRSDAADVRASGLPGVQPGS
jgi:MFS family permease